MRWNGTFCYIYHNESTKYMYIQTVINWAFQRFQNFWRLQIGGAPFCLIIFISFTFSPIKLLAQIIQWSSPILSCISSMYDVCLHIVFAYILILQKSLCMFQFLSVYNYALFQHVLLLLFRSTYRTRDVHREDFVGSDSCYPNCESE